MKFLAISDVHNDWMFLQHVFKQIKGLPTIDFIVFAGDLTDYGRLRPVQISMAQEGLLYFSEIAPVLFTLGNHDIGVSRDFDFLSPNIINTTRKTVEYNGLSFYGEPLSAAYTRPTLVYSWDFTTDRPEVEKEYFSEIPAVDILITHSPPYKRLDQMYSGENIGSKELFKKILKTQPSFNICGHVHEQGGRYDYVNKTTVINAAQNIVLYENSHTIKSWGFR